MTRWLLLTTFGLIGLAAPAAAHAEPPAPDAPKVAQPPLYKPQLVDQADPVRETCSAVARWQADRF